MLIERGIAMSHTFKKSEEMEPLRKRLFAILEGNEGAALVYGRVMTLLIVASIVPLWFKEPSVSLRVVEYLCVTAFIVDYIARWVTADLKLGKGALSFFIYPLTPMAIIDLLTILPTFMVLNDAFRTLRILRLFRALRAFRLIRYSKGAAAIAAVFAKQRQPLLIVFGLAIAYILVSATAIFTVEPDTFDTFFDAVYWAVVSLTTVGYGDLYPSTEIGRVIAMLSSLMGIAVVALPSGIITAGLLEELRSDNNRPALNAQ